MGEISCDFHNENILLSKINKFILLDWRQNFGGESLEYGDSYYDFAKLRHGFLVNHGIVDDEQFQIKEKSENSIEISIMQHSHLIECNNEFDNWLKKHNFDTKKVNILTALIYINICGLHEHPYAKFLYYYGQYLLSIYLEASK